MKIEKIKELTENGFTIKEMKDYLNEHFPDSFGFSVHRPDPKSRNVQFKEAEGEPMKGLTDADLKQKLYFPQVVRDHEENFRVYQGEENTYFDFTLDAENGDWYIASFGFKDRGDVPHEYITKFLVFLQAAYGLPFTVDQQVMKTGGLPVGQVAGYEIKGRKGNYRIEDIQNRLPRATYATADEVAQAFWRLVNRRKESSKAAAIHHGAPTQENLIDSDRYYSTGGEFKNKSYIVSNEDQTEFLSVRPNQKTVFWTPNKELAYPSATVKEAMDFEEKAESFIGDVRSYVVDFDTLKKQYGKGGKTNIGTKTVVLTEAEDAAYDKWMGHFLDNGKKEIAAENETIKILKNTFPRLKTLLTGDYKISLGTEADTYAEGGGVRQEFDRAVFLKTFKSNVDFLVNGLMNKAENESILIGRPVKTDLETRQMAVHFFQKQLAKCLYEFLPQYAKGGAFEIEDDEEGAFQALPYDGRDVVEMITNPENEIPDAQAKADKFIEQCGYTWRGDVADLKETLKEYAGTSRNFATGGNTTKTYTSYEELMSFNDIRDEKYFKKKYSDGVNMSSWIGPLLNYLDKVNKHLNAERAKENPDTEKIKFLKEQKIKLRGLDTPFYREVVEKKYATGGATGEDAEKKKALSLIKKWQIKDAKTGELTWKNGTPAAVKALADKHLPKVKEAATTDDQYVVDVMYRDAENYKKFVDNILVPKEYIAEYGIPKEGDEDVDIESLNFSTSDFFDLTDLDFNDERDHNKLEIVGVKKLSDIPEGEKPLIGTRKYKDYSEWTRIGFATGGPTGIQLDDYVSVSSGALDGAKGMVISIDGDRAKIELLELPKDEKHLRRTVKDFKLTDLAKIEDIFSYVKGKKYIVHVPKDSENPKSETFEDVGVAGDKEGDQVWVKGNAANYLVFPDELIGNEVEEHAKGGTTDIFSLVKGKKYKIRVPKDNENPLGESVEVVVTAGDREDDQVWVKSDSASYLVFPDELMGHEVEEHAKGGQVASDPSVDFVEFKGVHYPIRTIVIKGHGLTKPTEVVIGTVELEHALTKSKFKGKSGAIDGNIYHYVTQELLFDSPEKLAENLDEKYTIADKSEYASGGLAKGVRKHQTKKAVKGIPKHFKDAENFDIGISKALAEKTLNSEPKCAILEDISIMCKEKGAGSNWAEVQTHDLVNGKLPSIYKTFEIWIVGDAVSKDKCKDELKKLI